MQEIKVAFKAIVIRDGKILLIKRSDKEDVYQELWDIPGGRMEFAEGTDEALKREVREETNLEIDIIKPFRVWTFMASPEKQVVGITMLTRYVDGKVELSEEHTAYEWVRLTEIEGFDMDKYLKAELLEFAKGAEV